MFKQNGSTQQTKTPEAFTSVCMHYHERGNNDRPDLRVLRRLGAGAALKAALTKVQRDVVFGNVG
jgi:hypothetical protein